VVEVSGSPIEGFSGKQAAEIVNISYRQLDYWARTDLIRPSLADARGSGSRRRYSYRDLIELKLVKTLLDAGNRLENIRQAFHYIRDQLGEEISSAKLVLAGGTAVLVRENNELIDVFSRYKGQGVLNVLDLEEVKEEVDTAIELFPAPADAQPTSARKATSPKLSASHR
jgi:DNA-binding transcriptional MerR regulator